MVDKIKTTWLQCTVPQSEWDEINQRRLALKLTWKDVVLPGTLAYLDRLEAQQTTQQTGRPEHKTDKTKITKK